MAGSNHNPNGCTITQTEYCWYRLPCGYCSMLNRLCPMMGNQQIKIEPTWTLSTNSCETKEDADGD